MALATYFETFIMACKWYIGASTAVSAQSHLEQIIYKAAASAARSKVPQCCATPGDSVAMCGDWWIG